MPEQREPEAIKRQIQHAVAEAQESGASFSTLKAIWCDATDAEAKKAPSNSRFRQRLVAEMDVSCKYRRGHKDGQTPLFPPQLCSTKATSAPLSINSLGIQGPQSFSATARGLIINFGPLKFLVCLPIALDTK